MSGELSPNDPLYEAPPQNDGVDISSLSPEDLKIYKLYGKLPKISNVLNSRLKDRKYFDSGDYAMSKAALHNNNNNSSINNNSLGGEPKKTHVNVFADGSVGVINPLQNPNISNISRINRNSISGSSATGILSVGTTKSQLEKESTGDVFDDDDDDEQEAK